MPINLPFKKKSAYLQNSYIFQLSASKELECAAQDTVCALKSELEAKSDATVKLDSDIESLNREMEKDKNLITELQAEVERHKATATLNTAEVMSNVMRIFTMIPIFTINSLVTLEFSGILCFLWAFSLIISGVGTLIVVPKQLQYCINQTWTEKC